jgi:hypothetical protein
MMNPNERTVMKDRIKQFVKDHEGELIFTSIVLGYGATMFAAGALASKQRADDGWRIVRANQYGTGDKAEIFEILFRNGKKSLLYPAPD